ncbi:DELLA protein GAI1 [Linum perenne]
MADQIFSKNGGIEVQSPAGRSNQTSDSEPFERWIDSPERDDQFPIPIYHEEEANQISVRQGISELGEMIKMRNNSNPGSATSLFDLLGGARRNNHDTLRKQDVVVLDAADSVGLSTEELLRIAGSKFIQSSSSKSGDLAADVNSFAGLSDEELKNVELAEFLLAAAEQIGEEQLERASNLLTQCDLQSSPTGDPVQRLVYYFSRALRERIDCLTGKQIVMQKSDLVQEITMPTRECFLDFREKVPFGQVSQFAAIQAVVDSVAKATFIHIVDFNIKHGEQWTIFMQALISREENPVDHLKITAIGTMGKEMLEETGERLSDFAKAMSISFSFNLIMVEDFMDLNEEMFEVDCDETVAVLAEYLLTTLISRVEKLDSVMKVIRSLKPCVMVVTEVESNHNSPVFVNRFVQALFYASAFFDCLDVCMERESSHRRFAESAFLGEGTRIIVAAEGEERVIRNVKMEAWRAYFRRFGIKEADLSFSCLYQAELVARKFHSWRFCTVGLDGKSLIVGWKGTPIHSVTAWSFSNESY